MQRALHFVLRGLREVEDGIRDGRGDELDEQEGGGGAMGEEDTANADDLEVRKGRVGGLVLGWFSLFIPVLRVVGTSFQNN